MSTTYEIFSDKSSAAVKSRNMAHVVWQGSDGIWHYVSLHASGAVLHHDAASKEEIMSWVPDHIEE